MTYTSGQGVGPKAAAANAALLRQCAVPLSLPGYLEVDATALRAAPAMSGTELRASPGSVIAVVGQGNGDFNLFNIQKDADFLLEGPTISNLCPTPGLITNAIYHAGGRGRLTVRGVRMGEGFEQAVTHDDGGGLTLLERCTLTATLATAVSRWSRGYVGGELVLRENNFSNNGTRPNHSHHHVYVHPNVSTLSERNLYGTVGNVGVNGVPAGEINSTGYALQFFSASGVTGNSSWARFIGDIFVGNNNGVWTNALMGPGTEGTVFLSPNFAGLTTGNPTPIHVATGSKTYLYGKPVLSPGMIAGTQWVAQDEQGRQVTL